MEEGGPSCRAGSETGGDPRGAAQAALGITLPGGYDSHAGGRGAGEGQRTSRSYIATASICSGVREPPNAGIARLPLVMTAIWSAMSG